MLRIKGDYKDKGGVYRIVCEANGKEYIGQTANFERRFKEHSLDLANSKHHTSRLMKDYELYGHDSFYIEVISDDMDSRDDMERKMIAEARSRDCCYNTFSGGSIGFEADDEFRATMSRTHIGITRTEEFKTKHSEAAKKQWQDEAFRKTRIESVRRQWDNPEYRSKMHAAHAGKSEACGHKLTYQIVKEARERYANGERTSALAKEYGVSYSTMNQAINGTTWSNLK